MIASGSCDWQNIINFISASLPPELLLGKSSWKYPGKFGKLSAKMLQIGIAWGENPLCVLLFNFFLFCNFIPLQLCQCVRLCPWPPYSPRACFSKVPKIFGPISGASILLISSQCQGFKLSNCAILLVLLTLKTSSEMS